MQPLQVPLEALGLPVHLLTLPGHASSIEEFRAVGFADWTSYVERTYDRLAEKYDNIIVIGFSLGGALALHLAELRTPKAVVALAAPVFPRVAMPAQLLNWALLFTPGLRFLRKQVGERPCGLESQQFAPWHGYRNVVHPPHFYGMYKGFTAVRARLGQITCPILVMHDARDKVVNVRNAQAIINGVASERRELEITHMQENITVHHILTTHVETQSLVVNRVRSFVASVCALPEPASWEDSVADKVTACTGFTCSVADSCAK